MGTHGETNGSNEEVSNFCRAAHTEMGDSTPELGHIQGPKTVEPFFYWKPTKENKKSPKNGFIVINSNTKIYYFKRRSNILKEWQGTHSQFQFDPSLRASEERNMKQPQPWQITAVNVRYVPH